MTKKERASEPSPFKGAVPLKVGDRVRIIREYPPGTANMPHLGVDGKTGRLYGEPDGLGVSQFPYWVVVDDGDENPVWCHEVVALIDFEEAPLLDAWRTPPERVIYISGPMRGMPEHNYPAFHAAEEEIRGWGTYDDVVNPARHFEGRTDLDSETYLRKDVRMMAERCTAIYLMPGWQNSAGARIEYAVAQGLGMDIVTSGGGLMVEPVENEAQTIVRNGERQMNYGHPNQDFSRTAGMWSAYLGRDVTMRDVALMMAMLKMSRLKATPGHRDSLVDLIGYSICYERLEEVTDD